MNENHNLEENQPDIRRRYLQTIIGSESRRKLIVAGPGTGKTYTIGRLLRRRVPGSMLALTFIRNLVADMAEEFGDIAEVKTFHAYCKMLLHKSQGSVELAPYLTQVISEDAQAMSNGLSHFRDSFQLLRVDSPEVAYFLGRGDYYRAVCFDDSVFRVLRDVQNGRFALPPYDQIVIDEYQDFNPLEVAFIELLEQQGPILIVGDDDQAVYSSRNSSPDHLREKYHSGDYDLFELPFCSRCTEVVVEAIGAFVEAVIRNGAFSTRIPRPFHAFLEGREQDNSKYPRIITT